MRTRPQKIVAIKATSRQIRALWFFFFCFLFFVFFVHKFMFRSNIMIYTPRRNASKSHFLSLQLSSLYKKENWFKKVFLLTLRYCTLKHSSELT